MPDTRSQFGRPISPHLTIWRPTITYVMSIVHRMTGGALYIGMLLVTWWLLAAASGPNAYATLQGFTGSILGKLILFGFTWALLHHALGGIRHMIWDAGYGFGASEREWLAWATLIGSIALTLLIWIVGFLIVGAA